MNIKDSRILGNAAELGGGGIYNFGILTLIDTPVTGNSAVTFGGGIVNSEGTVTYINSPVQGNSAEKEADIVDFNQ